MGVHCSVINVTIIRQAYLFIGQERKEITVVVNSSISNLILVLETEDIQLGLGLELINSLLCSPASLLTISAV